MERRRLGGPGRPGLVLEPGICDVPTNLYGTSPEQPEFPMPLGHGTVDDMVDAVVFPASERARWITGQTLVVDGGWSLR